MKLKKHIVTASVLTAIAALSACSNDSDSDSSGNVVYGRITAFGSIFVNDTEYDTDGATIIVDDKSGSEDDLELGMMVKVHTSGDNKASSVEFSDDVEGIVTDVNLDVDQNGTITVMGYIVNLNDFTKREFKTSRITSLEEAIYTAGGKIEYVVEVSGYSDGNGEITATRIEVKDFGSHDSELEMKGFVKELNMGSQMFKIGNMGIVYDGSTEFDDMEHGSLADGQYVEVEGYGFDSQGRFIAAEIENEGEKGVYSDDDDDEYEIEGIASSITASSFKLNGQTVQVNDNTVGTEKLSNDALVQVKASMNSDRDLVAQEIETDEMDEGSHDYTELKGIIEAIDLDNNTVTVMGKTIKVSSSTMMVDDHEDVRYFGIHDINLSTGEHYIEVKVYMDDSGDLVAAKFEYEGPEEEDESEIEGALTVDNEQASILGISMEFGDHPLPVSGSRIEAEGTYSDGVFYVSSVEMEDSDESDDSDEADSSESNEINS